MCSLYLAFLLICGYGIMLHSSIPTTTVFNLKRYVVMYGVIMYDVFPACSGDLGPPLATKKGEDLLPVFASNACIHMTLFFLYFLLPPDLFSYS